MTYKTSSALLLGTLLSFSLSCGGDDEFKAELLTIEPDKAYEGQEVTLLGTGMGTSQLILTLLSDGVTEFDISEAATSWSDTELMFIVPPGLEEEDFVIHLEDGVQTSNRLRFDILLPPDPDLLDVVPPAGEPGDTLTLTGTDFGDTPGQVIFYPSEDGAVSAWSDTEITVTVPNITEGKSIRVARASGFLSPWFPFSVADPSIPTLSLIQDTIFTPRCSTGSCHGSIASGDMSLLPGASFDNLVSTESRLDGVLRVTPFAPDSSLLIDKLENDSPAIGSRMPLNSNRLTQTQIDLIRAWIDEGAQDN